MEREQGPAAGRLSRQFRAQVFNTLFEHRYINTKWIRFSVTCVEVKNEGEWLDRRMMASRHSSIWRQVRNLELGKRQQYNCVPLLQCMSNW